MRKILFVTLLNFLWIFNVKAQDTLKVGYSASPPFIIENEQIVEGINLWLWQRICEETGIQYQLVKMPLDTIIQCLASNTIDMALTPMTITSERSKIMDFTSPYFITHSGILTKSSANESQFTILDAIWSWRFIKLLGTLAIIVCSFGFALWFFERRKNSEQFDKGWKGVGNGIWWSAVTMTTVGYGDKTPKTPFGKVIAIIWMFVAIMIISGFTASITTSLTINDLSFDEQNIMTYKNKTIGTLNQSNSESWVTKHFFSKINSYPSVDKAIEALKQGEVEAVSYGIPMLRYVEQNDIEKIYTVQNVRYNPQMYAFGIAENISDETKEKIEFALLKIVKTSDWKVILNTYGLLNENNE